MHLQHFGFEVTLLSPIKSEHFLIETTSVLNYFWAYDNHREGEEESLHLYRDEECCQHEVERQTHLEVGRLHQSLNRQAQKTQN